MNNKKMATREAYGEALKELGRTNSQVVVLDADLSKSTKTSVFAKAFPDRFFNMGIAEQNLMGTAAGLSTCGKIPFASTFAIFATGRAYEQIRNSIAYPKLNVKVAASHAGVTVGEDGATHQAIEDVALMRGLPGMTVIVPTDALETWQVVHAAAELQGPVYIRLGRAAVEPIYADDYEFAVGKAVTVSEGKDATIIANGIMVAEAKKAAALLSEKGISVRVLSMPTVKPLDEEAVILAARETGAIVTAEEHSIIGGLGSAVAEVIGEQCPVPLRRVGIADVFGESGVPADLLVKYKLTAADIADAVNSVLALK